MEVALSGSFKVKAIRIPGLAVAGSTVDGLGLTSFPKTLSLSLTHTYEYGIS